VVEIKTPGEIQAMAWIAAAAPGARIGDISAVIGATFLWYRTDRGASARARPALSLVGWGTPAVPRSG
jgi:hypothetical protein